MVNKFTETIKTNLNTTKRKIIFGIVVVLVLLLLVIGADMLYQGYAYVNTDNARIAAPLIPVSVLAQCQVITVDVDYGDYIEMGQKIASVGQPRPSNPIDRQGFKDIPMGKANVESPVSGYVAAIWTYPGAVVNTGQSLITIYDISNIWVSANISEAEIHRIKSGQEVEITVDSLGGKQLKGKVEGIAAATSASFSLLPQNNTTGNFIKVIQVVPVKISIDSTDGYILVPGTSVEVKIATK
jgi:multidrug resistance efflux pump